MKNVLLGTTALVAAGLVASNAHAAQGVQLGLGGYYAAAAGELFSQDNGTGDPGHNTRNTVFRQDVEIHFKGETTLDNGLTVGAVIQLEGQQSNDQIDEVWAYFKGGWGQIRFGDDDDAIEQLAYAIPSASNIFGVDTPYFEFANNLGPAGFGNVAQTNTTMSELSGDATKIIYFSPTFGGFNFAVSYAPDRRGEDTYSGFSTANGPGGTSFSNNAGQIQDVVSAAANYQRDFNGVGLVVGGGGGHGKWENPLATQDDSVWNARGHVQVSFDGFTIGSAGEYTHNYASFTPDVNQWVYGVGATYNWDAWTVGLAWSHGTYEVASNADKDNLDIVEATGRYDLGPGISLDAMVGFNDYNNDNGSGTPGGGGDNKTWEAGLGFYIGF
ncbi:MAG: porin [Pseudomonadota bacterium]